MKRRRSWLLTGILVTLLMAACSKNPPNTQNPLCPFDWSKIQAVEFESFEHAARFQKDATGRWWRQPFASRLRLSLDPSARVSLPPQKIHSENLTDFLTTLTVLDLGAPIAENTSPEKFEINAYSARLTFLDAAHTILTTVLIGKKGSDQNSTYVMRSGDSHVYWVPQDIRTPFFELLMDEDENQNGAAQEKN